MPLEGELAILREEQRQDQAFLAALRNDLQTQAWSKALPPDYTEAMYVKRFEDREFSYERNEARFIIVDKETDEPAGHIGYTNLDPRFSVGIGIVIAQRFWGTGIAFDAQETLLAFLFQELGVRVVRLWTHSGNPRAVRLAQRSGFRISARMREAIFKNGQRYDNLILDLLREEYFALHPDLTDDLPAL